MTAIPATAQEVDLLWAEIAEDLRYIEALYPSGDVVLSVTNALRMFQSAILLEYRVVLHRKLLPHLRLLALPEPLLTACDILTVVLDQVVKNTYSRDVELEFRLYFKNPNRYADASARHTALLRVCGERN